MSDVSTTEIDTATADQAEAAAPLQPHPRPIRAKTAPALLRLNELSPLADDQFAPHGPVGAACAVIAGSWFLTREVELSTARAALIEFGTDGFGNQVVRWRRPASKNDQEAQMVWPGHMAAAAVRAISLHALFMRWSFS